MIAANGSRPFLEPIHYIDGKQTTKRKLSVKNRTKQKPNSRRRKPVKNAKIQQLPIEDDSKMGTKENKLANCDNTSNDPLFTPQVLIKCELGEEKFELESEIEHQHKEEEEEEEDEESEGILKSCEDDDDDEDYCWNDCAKDEELVTEEEEDEAEESEENYYEEEELLIGLKKNSSRRRMSYKKTKTPSLKSCLANCKFKCISKYNDQQRLDIFHYYWQLSKQEKLNFIREHIRKQLSKRSRVTKVRHNCCYFLKHYKIEKLANSVVKRAEEMPQRMVESSNSICSSNAEDLTKVCRTFFNGTLRISDQEIKEAFKGFQLKPEKLAQLPFVQADKEEESLNVANEMPKEEKAAKLYLDPETGALTATKPKKKSKPRKRDEPAPKRLPKPVRCAIRCKFNCSEKFSEADRTQICDVFWSLDFKRRKDFILSRIETEDVKAPTNPEFRKTNRPIRSYQTKFYLRSGPKSESVRVCKHFLENTLRVNTKFVDNAIKFSDKKTGAYTGSDRRGCKVPHNKTPPESKQTVLDHINSYAFWLPNKKSKIKYLHYSLAIKKMHNAYKEKCLAANVDPLTARMYYKVFHEDFHLLFLSNPHPKKGRGYYKANPNIAHYTGDEPGGCWFDSHGTKLDLSRINPALTLDVQQNNLLTNISSSYSLTASQRLASGSAEQGLNLVYHPAAILPLNKSLAVINHPTSH